MTMPIRTRQPVCNTLLMPKFIDTGSNANVSPLYQTTSIPRQLTNVRSFPKGPGTVYTLRPAQGMGGNYLIRATFMYGNYDSLNKPPVRHSSWSRHLGYGEYQ
ncbi:hypothetical protein Nepgr_019469 [Nepenthes gracilis]|uniref:Malectin-like domain-containing protein n=1 Tax=Nepenthes gracilis TaxID=150966 RepID=A0AAD3STI7_NEPGR|nr:hypothetical protein Nepgr_019469 [Nepenthes gracilis]